MEKKQHVVSRRRQINTYAEMWRVSYWTMRQAEERLEGSFFQIMASLVFTAFTLEAYLNHLGKKIFKYWDDLEGLSPKKKLNVIAEKLAIDADYGKRPFQTVQKLFDFRNDVAHGKTVLLKSEDIVNVSSNNVDKSLHKPIEPNWEKYCTLDNAKRAREDVKNIMENLHKASGIKGDLLFFTGFWLGSASVI